MKIALVKLQFSSTSQVLQPSCQRNQTSGCLCLILKRDISLKPLLREMSSFKKILISTEMSSKIEVIVPKHQADNSPWMHTWEEFCEDLFPCVSPERHGDINGWKSSYTNKVYKDFLEVFIFCCENVSTIKWAIILSHFNRWQITEMSLIISTDIFLFPSWPSFVFLSITPCFFLCKFSSTARYFSPIDNLKADSISAPCTLLMIQWREYHSTF